MKKCSKSAHESLTELNITPLLDPPWGGLRVLGYPGFLLAGRTGPAGWIEFEPSYRWPAVAAWNAVSWAVVLPLVLWAGLALARAIRGRNPQASPQTAFPVEVTKQEGKA